MSPADPAPPSRPTGPGRQRTHATKAAVNALVVGALLIVLSASTRDGWLVLLAGLSFGLVLAALVLRPRLDRVEVTVLLPARARAGDPVTATLVATNSGRRAAPAMTVGVCAPGIDRVEIRVPALPADGSATGELVLVPRGRGEVTGLEVTLRTSAPLSVLAVALERTLPVHLLVHPVLDAPLVLAPAGTGDAAATTVAVAPGIDVQGVREWHRGESTGRLYARGTARQGIPLVLDRYDDAGHGVAFVIADSSGHPLWEPTVAVVAGTLVDTARQGRPVALVAHQRGFDDVVAPDAVALLDGCARLAEPQRPTVEVVHRAAAAIGTGGSVVLVDLRRTIDPATLTSFVSVASAEQAAVLVLHPLGARTDALCLHDARGTCPGAGS